MRYNATLLTQPILAVPLTGAACDTIYQPGAFIWQMPGQYKIAGSLFLKHKQSLEKNSLTFNCSFMTQNIWLQSSKPTNFIGNYYGAEQITYHSCFIQKMYLLPLLYAARHTLIFLQRSSTFIYNYPFSRLT